jgi:hypothetical protein
MLCSQDIDMDDVKKIARLFKDLECLLQRKTQTPDDAKEFIEKVVLIEMHVLHALERLREMSENEGMDWEHRYDLGSHLQWSIKCREAFDTVALQWSCLDRKWQQRFMWVGEMCDQNITDELFIRDLSSFGEEIEEILHFYIK